MGPSEQGAACDCERALASARPFEKRVLVVDDSATMRALEKGILEAAGHEVLVAAHGGRAWQLLQEQGADLVLSDVQMPNMDGHALTQTIRGSKRFRDLPVILLTSLESEQDRARGLASGANAYFVKSAFDHDCLLETIRRLL
jgi:two-component system chemotaxis sensor kinase CheA